MDDSTRIKAPGVPVELRPGLRVYLKYNLLSSIALEHRFGDSNPLAALLRMTPSTATDTVALLIGAALLQKAAVIGSDQDDEDWQELLADVKGIRRGTVLAEDEAARIGRVAMEVFDGETMDASPLVNAIVKAADIARPLDPCARCEHALGMHGWFEPCTADGCRCEGFTRRCASCPHMLTDHAVDGKCTISGCKCRPGPDAGKVQAPGLTGAGSSTPSPSGLAAVSGSSG